MSNKEKFTAYVDTSVSADDTKQKINQLLKKYGVKQVAWRWDAPYSAEMSFPIQNVVVRIPVSKKLPFVQGMRALFWHLKTWFEELALDMPAEQVFMPYIVIRGQNGALTTIVQAELPRIRQSMLKSKDFPMLVNVKELKKI